MIVSRSAVARFVKKYKETETICRRPGSGHLSKMTPEVLHIVEDQMQLDDETTAVQLQKLLFDNRQPLSLKTILRSRSKLGWTFRGSACCQLIQQPNNEKHLDWPEKNLQAALKDEFFCNS